MTTQTEERALEVVDRVSGEVIDVRRAPMPQLATFFVNLAELRDQLSDAERVVQAEALARLDRAGKWTDHVTTHDGRHLVDLKAPSPAAGTVTFDPDDLETALQMLVDEIVIDTGAAERALERTVTVTFRIPWGESVDEFVDTAKADEKVVDVSPSRKPVKAGIAAIEKLGDVAKSAIAEASRHVPASSRRVSIKSRPVGGAQ